MEIGQLGAATVPNKLQFSLRTILELFVVVAVVMMLVLQTTSRPASPPLPSSRERYQTFVDDKIVYLTDTWTGEMYTANMRARANPNWNKVMAPVP
jgi:hypothetical protein